LSDFRNFTCNISISQNKTFSPLDIAEKINLPGASEPQLLADSSLMFLRHSIMCFLVIKLTIVVLLLFPKIFYVFYHSLIWK